MSGARPYAFIRDNSATIVLWVLVWALFALMEVLKGLYFAGPVHVWRHVAEALFIFAPWIGFSVVCGWLSGRYALYPRFDARHLTVHVLAAIAVALVHLATITGSFWLFWPNAVAKVTVGFVYGEQFFKWFHFELLVYAACGLLWHWRIHASTTRPDEQPRPGTILLTVDDEQHRVETGAISWLQADDNYVIVHCGHGQLRVRQPLKKVLEALDHDTFTQVHRSAVVNLNDVRCVERERVVLKNGARVPISRRRRGELLQQLKPGAADRA